MLIGIRPVSHLGTVEELDGARAARPFSPSGTDFVATVYPREVEFVRIRRPSGRLHRCRAVIVESISHAKQILGGLFFMGQDERLVPTVMRDLVICPTLDVGGEALLSALEADQSYPASLRTLRLSAFMQVELGFVEGEGFNPARFGSDLQASRRIDREVSRQTFPCL